MDGPAVDRREIYSAFGEADKKNSLFEVFDSGMRYGNTITNAGLALLFPFEYLFENLLFVFNFFTGVDSAHNFGKNFIFCVRFQMRRNQLSVYKIRYFHNNPFTVGQGGALKKLPGGSLCLCHCPFKCLRG